MIYMGFERVDFWRYTLLLHFRSAIRPVITPMIGVGRGGSRGKYIKEGQKRTTCVLWQGFRNSAR
jgi:hypothetical protein